MAIAFWRQLVKGAFWKKVGWYLLLPIRFVVALGYGFGIKLRNLLYDRGLLPVYRLPRPVISIGNITLGGTGKTPFTLYLIELFQSEGIKVGYISRGYRRKTRGAQEVQLERDFPALHYGDEALQVKLRHPQIPVFVGEDRYVAGQRLLENYPDIQTILLDDAFQHRRLYRDIDILLIDLRRPAWKDWIFPLGRLREPLRSYLRAHLLVLNQKHKTDRKVRSGLRRHPMAHFIYEVQDIWHPDRGSQPVDSLTYKPVLAFCGIACPESFKLAIQRIPAYLTAFFVYPDHHFYSLRELIRIRKEFQRLRRGLQLKELVLLTTEKDLARFYRGPHAGPLEDLPLYALRIRMKPFSPQEEAHVRYLITFAPVYGNP